MAKFSEGFGVPEESNPEGISIEINRRIPIPDFLKNLWNSGWGFYNFAPGFTAIRIRKNVILVTILVQIVFKSL